MPAYDTETLAHDMCMSRMQLNRKLNALTGQSTHEVVREFRLERAAAVASQPRRQYLRRGVRRGVQQPLTLCACIPRTVWSRTLGIRGE